MASKEKFLEQLGDKIRNARTEQETSLNQFASTIGVAASHLSQIERGEADPRITVLIAIAKELDADLVDLIP